MVNEILKSMAASYKTSLCEPSEWPEGGYGKFPRDGKTRGMHPDWEGFV